jgi:transcription elongation factor Elf1
MSCLVGGHPPDCPGPDADRARYMAEGKYHKESWELKEAKGVYQTDFNCRHCEVRWYQDEIAKLQNDYGNLLSCTVSNKVHEERIKDFSHVLDINTKLKDMVLELTEHNCAETISKGSSFCSSCTEARNYLKALRQEIEDRRLGK